MIVLILALFSIVVGLVYKPIFGIKIKPFVLKNYPLFLIILIMQFGYRFLESLNNKPIIVMAIESIILILLIIFIFYNKSQFSIILIGIGFVLNYIVMIFNNGRMPAYVNQELNNDIRHIIIDSNTKLLWLSDIIGLPYPLSIGAYRFSIGDLLIWVGVTIIGIQLIYFNVKNKN